MRQTPEAVQQNLAERLCWQAAYRDDSRVARRLYRKQVVDGVYQLDEGAWLEAFFYFLRELGVGDWLGDIQGPAAQRAGCNRAVKAMAAPGRLQGPAGAAGCVSTRRRATPGAAHHGAHLPGCVGR